MAKSWIQEGWKIGAKFAVSPVGSKGILSFKACDRCFQIALRQGWTNPTNSVRDFAVFQFSLLLLTLGVIYDFPSWLFWLASLPVLWVAHFLFVLILSLQSDPRAALFSGLFLLFIRSPAHFTLYLCWPPLTYLEYSVIHKSPFPNHSESAGIYSMSLPPTPSSRAIVSPLYSQNLRVF